MQGIETAYCDVCINALVGAWRGLMEASALEAIQKVHYGKSDTFGLDAITEIIISSRLREFDRHALLITEELDDQARRRWPTDSDPVKQPLMFFSDPTDQSNQLCKFLQEVSKDDPIIKVGVRMESMDAAAGWEKMFGAPVDITASTTSITCVRKGEIIFSVILNFIARTIVVAVDTGVFLYRLKPFTDESNEDITLAEITRSGERIAFPGIRDSHYSPDECKRFVTFLGKEGYRENFRDSMLFVEDPDQYIHYKEPPGPPRALYLSNLQKKHGPVGFILANGEKIGEWIPWLSFVKHARNERGSRALRAFEIFLARPWTKNGMLMSTSPAYSIFAEGPDGKFLDMSRLRSFERPSQFRCMLVVVPSDNERITHVLQQHQYREVTEFF